MLNIKRVTRGALFTCVLRPFSFYELHHQHLCLHHHFHLVTTITKSMKSVINTRQAETEHTR